MIRSDQMGQPQGWLPVRFTIIAHSHMQQPHISKSHACLWTFFTEFTIMQPEEASWTKVPLGTHLRYRSLYCTAAAAHSPQQCILNAHHRSLMISELHIIFISDQHHRGPCLVRPNHIKMWLKIQNAVDLGGAWLGHYHHRSTVPITCRGFLS